LKFRGVGRKKEKERERDKREVEVPNEVVRSKK
jgi:hypothetical protein